MDIQLNLPYPVVVFDTETGGLNPDDEVSWTLSRSNTALGSSISGKFVKHAAPILEIGAVILNPITLQQEAEFHSLCGPEKDESFEEFISKASPKALEVNGFKDRLDELKAAPPLSKALKDFINFLPKSQSFGKSKFIPCGQNVMFDIDMINMSCLRYGINFQIKSTPLELVSYSQLYFSLPDTQIVANYKLTTVAQALGISIEDAHTALADVQMTASCIRKMFQRFSS